MLADGANLSQSSENTIAGNATTMHVVRDKVSLPMIVVHQALDADPTQRSERTSAVSGPKTVLSPLPPGDSGLQLLSDDHAWLNRAAPLLRALPVTYLVRLARSVDCALVSRLMRGVTDHGEFLAAAEARLVDSEPTRDWMEVTLNHGRSTTVRRLFTAFGVTVQGVKRTAVGPIQLGSLASNQQRSLTEEERTGLPALHVG